MRNERKESQHTMSQQQQEEERRRRIADHLDGARRNAHNAVQVGISTFHELEDQSEALDHVEDLLEDSNDLVTQSMRVLRGMTWSGSLYNVYSDITSSLSGKANSDEIIKDESPLVRYHAKFDKPESAESSSSSTLLRSSPQRSSRVDGEEAVLDELSTALETIKVLGVAMGEKLQQQNEQLDRIDTMTDRVYDKTLAVTIKSSKLSRYSTEQGEYVGTFQFLTDNDAFMLATHGDSLVLTRTADLSSLFKCVVRQATVLGLQSEVTGKFVGCTMWGNVAVMGEYFGSQEECIIDITGKSSGLLLAARNWNAGGWLKMNSSCFEIANDEPIVISTTTSSITDRSDILMFKAVKCK